jgi:transcriptional regulator with XRE-family HTH domain
MEQVSQIRDVFAANFNLVLEARSITNKELADAIGRSDGGAVSKWRSGRHVPPLDVLERIGWALDLPPYALLIPRPSPEQVVKALKTLQGDKSADRGTSIGRARRIVTEAAYWAEVQLADESAKTLRTVAPNGGIDPT